MTLMLITVISFSFELSFAVPCRSVCSACNYYGRGTSVKRSEGRRRTGRCYQRQGKTSQTYWTPSLPAWLWTQALSSKSNSNHLSFCKFTTKILSMTWLVD